MSSRRRSQAKGMLCAKCGRDTPHKILEKDVRTGIVTLARCTVCGTTVKK